MSAVKELVLFDETELEKIQKPINKATYKSEYYHENDIIHKKKVRFDPNERIICTLCSGKYTRSNKYHHENTKLCKAHRKFNDKLKKVFLS